MTGRATIPLLVAGLAGVLAILYAPTGRDLVAIWAGDSYSSYGFLILAWSAWLAWSTRAHVRATPRRSEPRALALVAAGIALLAAARIAASLTFAVLSLPFVLVGLGRFALGREAFRPWLFPAAFLVFMTPLPGWTIPVISLPLQELAADFTAVILAALGIPFRREGLFFGLDAGVVHIAESCSGLRFLLVMVVLGTGCAWAIERRLGLRLITFAAAVAAAIVANLIRVAGTVALVHVYGLAAATGPFHSVFGKVLYLIALIAFLLVAFRLRVRPTMPAPAVSPLGAKGGFCRP